MAEDKMEFTFNLRWEDHLAFTVEWDLPEAPDLFTDEPPALGGSGRGPNASRLVVAGVANCMAASLLFCLTKVRADVRDFRIRAHGTILRSPEGRLRLRHIRIEPLVHMSGDQMKRLARCVGMFEDFCIVTDSVRNGVPVDVQVFLVGEDGEETPVEARVRQDPPGD